MEKREPVCAGKRQEKRQEKRQGKRNRVADCSSCGKLMLLTGVLVAVPLAVLPFYPQDAVYAGSFAVPALGSVLLGGRPVCLEKRRMTAEKGSLPCSAAA